jgi:hypothetical protein
MPSWFYTTVTITGPQDALARLKTAHFRTHDNGDQYLDFETIIPMPAILEGSESSSVVADGLYVLRRVDVLSADRRAGSEMLNWSWVKEAGITTEEELKAELLRRCPDCVERAKKAIALYETTGYGNWRDWCCDNWGTTCSRFAAIYPNDPPGTMHVHMATAWAPPLPVFEKLAQLYPELTFEVEGLDEMDYDAMEPSYRWSSRQADAA